MKTRWICLVLLLVLPFAMTGCNKLKAKDQLNKGIQAYKDKEFEQAEKNFEAATKLDPDLEIAWEYYAQSKLQQISSSMGNPADKEKAMGAIEIYQGMKERNKSAVAFKNIAKLYARLTQCQTSIVTPEEMKQYTQKAREALTEWMKVDPDNKEPLAMMGEFIITLSDKELRNKNIQRNSDLDKIEDAEYQPIIALVDEGIKYYSDASKKDPNDIKVIEGLIVGYNQKLWLTKDYVQWDEMNKLLGDLKLKRYEQMIKLQKETAAKEAAEAKQS